MKLFINSNCPQEQIFVFDLLATATGLYKVADVVLDASKSKHICFSLNTPYMVMLSSFTEKINEESITVGIDKFYRNKQISGIYLNDKCDEFMKNSLNHLYPIESASSLDLEKEFELENISMNDVITLREFLQIGISPPFFIRFPYTKEKVFLNSEGKIIYEDKSFNLNEKDLRKIVNLFLKKKFFLRDLQEDFFEAIKQSVTPIYFDKNIDIFNKKVTTEGIVKYKQRFIKFLKDIGEEIKNDKYLGFNKNALSLLDIIAKNKEQFNDFLSK